jgi:MFS family permease
LTLLAKDCRSPTDSDPAHDERYAWWVVVVLMLAYVLSFVDRQILSLLVQPIRAEFGISDTQMGLLQGFSFALFYTVLGLPMGRMVDRLNRRNLIAAGVFLWSGMTAICGAATSYGTLFLARMGVGVGEAALSPAAFSMIADYFRRERLATALSIYAMGVFIGAGLAFIVGGAVVDLVANRPPIHVPGWGPMGAWRVTFLLVGLPGLVLAVVVWRLREPERRSLQRSAAGDIAVFSVADTIRTIKQRRGSVLGITTAMAFHAICMYGVFAWMPTSFVRRFSWTAGEAGLALGSVVLVFGCIGMSFGGWLTDRWHRLGRRDAPLRVGVLAALLIVLGGAASPALGQPASAVLALVPLVLGLALPVGSLFASLQLIFPNQARGQVSAIFLCVISLFGITFGPLIPAIWSDRYFGGGVGIATALGGTIVVAASLMALALLGTLRSYRSDRERFDREI